MLTVRQVSVLMVVACVGLLVADRAVAAAILQGACIVAVAIVEAAELVFKRATQIVVNIDNSSAISEQEEPDDFGFK